MINEDQFIDEYLRQILKSNEITNLTAITDFNTARILHIEDSLSALPEINAASDGLYGDLGTGGGFPGVPIAVKTKRDTILVDSIKKKINSIKSILDTMGCELPITTFSGRIEDLSLTHRNEFSVLTARALSSLPSLLELSAPLLNIGGILVCYKGLLDDEEMQSAVDLESILGLKLHSKRHFLLSDKETNRTIITFKKISEPTMKLPRKTGIAQKRPLHP